MLTIAGHDPSSGAGITADLAVFAAHGLNGISAITALTVQSTAGVRATAPVDPGLLRATLECLEADLPPAGIKIGMMGSGAAAEVVADYIEVVRQRTPRPIVVLDTVLRSSSGSALLDAAGRRVIEQRLLGAVDWVTPNVDELSMLTGVRAIGRDDVPGAARALEIRYPGLGVLATGGHLEPPDDLLLAAGAEPLWLAGRRIETRATHGTGCAFSSAFLCELVQGAAAGAAARAAKDYVTGAMEHAIETGTGPCAMNHLWKMAPKTR